MTNASAAEIELMQSLLEPLLEDFKFWFGRSLELLEREQLNFMTAETQADLITRVRNVMGEVNAASALYKITDKQVGVDVTSITSWHRLLMECQGMGMRYRQSKAVEE